MIYIINISLIIIKKDEKIIFLENIEYKNLKKLMLDNLILLFLDLDFILFENEIKKLFDFNIILEKDLNKIVGKKVIFSNYTENIKISENLILIPFRKTYDKFLNNYFEKNFNYNKIYGNIVSIDQIQSKINLIKSKIPKKDLKYVIYIFSKNKINQLLKLNLLKDYDNYVFNYIDFHEDFEYKIDILFHKYINLIKNENLEKKFELENQFNEKIKYFEINNTNIKIYNKLNLNFFKNRYESINNIKNYFEKNKIKFDNIIIKLANTILINKNYDKKIIIEKFKNSLIKFPIIIKTNDSIFLKNSHEIYLIKNYEGLHNFLENDIFKNLDFIIQEYIYHYPVLYKIYKFFNYNYIYHNSSIGNNEINSDCFKFNSNTNFLNNNKIIFNLENNTINSIANEFEKILDNVNLFGLDFINKKDTNEFYLIDINYFPSFRNLENGFEYFKIINN